VIAGLLFGPEGIKWYQDRKTFPPRNCLQPYAKRWRLNHLTPECIAAAGIYVSVHLSVIMTCPYALNKVMFALSNDDMFQPYSLQSCIPYQQHYKAWLGWFHDSIAKQKPSCIKLLKHYNDIFFPNATNDDATEKIREQRLHAIQDAPEDEDDMDSE
jgi:hypothetical protein